MLFLKKKIVLTSTQRVFSHNCLGFFFLYIHIILRILRIIVIIAEWTYLMTTSSAPNTSNTLKKKKRKEKSRKHFGFRMKATLKESNISPNDIHESFLPQTARWLIKKKTRCDFRTEWTPLNKNPSQYLLGEISQYRPTPSRTLLCLYGWLQGQWQNGLHSCFILQKKKKCTSISLPLRL